MGINRIYLVLTLILVGIVSVQAGAYYYFQRIVVPSGSCPVAVCTLIAYGNATMKWYNETSVGPGWNFYNFTLFLTGGSVEAQFYGPPLSEHFVTAINGVKNHSPYFWTLWIFCQRQHGWEISPLGADEIQIKNGQTFAWAYEMPYSSPVPGARTVDSCS